MRLLFTLVLRMFFPLEPLWEEPVHDGEEDTKDGGRGSCGESDGDGIAHFKMNGRHDERKAALNGTGREVSATEGETADFEGLPYGSVHDDSVTAAQGTDILHRVVLFLIFICQVLCCVLGTAAMGRECGDKDAPCSDRKCEDEARRHRADEFAQEGKNQGRHPNKDDEYCQPCKFDAQMVNFFAVSNAVLPTHKVKMCASGTGPVSRAQFRTCLVIC